MTIRNSTPLDSLTKKELHELWPFLNAREREELDALLSMRGDWTPNPGPQTWALESKADVLGYGGAAGGGKTDLLLGAAHTRHRKSIIFRRQFPQLDGIEERALELFSGHGKFNGQKHRWRLDDRRIIEFGASDDEKDVIKYQGRPHDLKCFDELPHFTKYQFQFLSAWNRTTIVGQRTRVIAAFNPPTDAEGDWVIEYWGPWLDKTHPHPAKPGELRWYAAIDGHDVERPDGKPFWHGEELIQPRSRTFIPARVEDNPFLMATGYKATLQQLPEPLRSLMLKGSFDVRQEDHPWQVIPTEWIRTAQARWKPKMMKDRGPLSAIGIDVARGGRDQSIYTPRYGNWFAEQVTKPGKATPDGQSVIRDALPLLDPEKSAPINVDVVGIGSSPADIGRMFELKIVALNGSNGSAALDKSKKLRFFNKRAEWAWKLREALDPTSQEDLAIPPDREILADLAAMRWELLARGIKIEAKDDIKDRIHRSPDKGESLIYAHARETSGAVIAAPIVMGGGARDIPGQS